MDLKAFTHKMLMIMRMTSWVLLLATMHVSANGISQNVSVIARQASLEQVFKQIKKQTSFLFLYNQDVIGQSKPVSFSAHDQPLEQVLEQVFKDQPLVYMIMEKNILVKLKPATTTALPDWSALPPPFELKGIVVDGKTTNPIAGASIQVKGTKSGTSTNGRGEFTITVEQGTVLQVSFVGYNAEEYTVKNNAKITIQLQPSVRAMEDMVLTGVYTRRKESFTGAASTFTGEQLKQVSNQNILQALKVLDPAFVQLENTAMGSNPNSLPDVQIRGATSLPDLTGEYSGGNPNQPLFILDGFETTLLRIYDLDMNRVSSITLLKDAAAKAIYGSRAANGVVVVETKRPQAGRLRLTYNADVNVNAPDLNSYDLTNASEKLQAELNAGMYTAAYQPETQALMEQYNEHYKDIIRGVNTYWLSKPLRVGIGQKHAIALEGGDNYLRYGVDLAYNNITGVMKGSARQTTSGTVTLSYRVNKLLFRNLLTVSFNKADDSPYGNFSEYTRLNPYWSTTDSIGRTKKILGSFTSSSGATIKYANPLYNATLGTKNFSRYTEIVNNFYAEWTLSATLKLIGRFGFSQKQDTREDFYPASHTRYIDWTGDAFFKRGDYTITNGTSRYFKPDITLNYIKQFNKHMLLFNAGWNMLQNTFTSYGLAAQGFLNDRVDYISFARQYKENGRPTGLESTSREVGVLASMNYSYDNRYLMDLTARRNGSSVYGSDNRWGNFWSAGLGWNLHNEPMFRGNTAVNLLKVRGSIGYTGNQNFNPYQAMATYNYYTDNYYDNVVSAKLMALANNSLKWQQTQDLNMGIDAQLFKRVNLRFDYYISNSDKLLVDLSLPTSTGFESYRQNVGAMQNKGFDANLSYRVYNNVRKEAFVNLYVSAAHNKNNIVRLNNALDSYNDKQDASTSTRPRTRYKEGQSTTVIWAVPSLGIDPITGQEVFRKADGGTTYTWNADDQQVLGDASPKLNGSFGLNAQYKGFGMNGAFTYRLGGQYYNQTMVDRVENVDIHYNVDRRVFTQTWKQPGDNTFYKRISATANTTKPSSRFVEDLDEWQLTSLNVYYDFRYHRFIKKAGLQGLRITLYTIDVARVATVKAERGTDYPFARTFSFSLRANF